MIKTRYFKVTTESRPGEIYGERALESRIDVQELKIQRLAHRVYVPDTYSVEPIGDPRRVCKRTPAYELELLKEHQRGFATGLWEQMQEHVFSFFLLSDFIAGFKRAVKGLK